MLEQKDFDMLRQMIGDVVEEKLDEKLEEKLAPIEARLDKTDERLTSLENYTQRTDERLASIDDKLQELTRMDNMILDEVVRVHEYAANSIEELKGDVKELRRNQRTSDHYEEMCLKIAELERKIKESESRTA